MQKILITIGILCFGLLLISCLSNKKSRNIFCVQKFELRATTVLNPDKAFIKILTDKRLKKVLLSKEWDSINFSGGIFDTLNFNHRLIGVAETDSPNELVIGIATAKFFSCTQDQKDSIASITFEKVEINIFSKDGAWELKPCSKSETLF